MTVITKKPTNPVAHLTPEDIEQLGLELDAIRQEVLDSRGERDAAYIRRVIKTQRYLELGSRAVLLGSLFPPAFVVGTVGLSIAKILDNMEIGHNVLHGQWDWMRDPKIHSSTWDWDMASTAEGWKHTHNEIHHTYTNIVGKDNDLGYGIMRLDEDQEWRPFLMFQPLTNFLNMVFFEYGIAFYDMDLGARLRAHEKGQPWDPKFLADLKAGLRKIGRQMRKDYLIHPLLSGPSAANTLVANAIANVVRNVWSHAIIMCGHFPEGVETYELEALPEDEGRGDWYLRQMLGSANISGSRLLHLMSGNLSHQIEHHLWPDLPSNRYREVAPKVQAVFEKYGLSYHSRPFVPQVASAWHRIVRLSFPNNWLATTRVSNLGSQIGVLRKMVTGSKQVREALQRRLDYYAGLEPYEPSGEEFVHVEQQPVFMSSIGLRPGIA
jgi:NADPH-dependent stearoyl-CoA 9-desaturase